MLACILGIAKRGNKEITDPGRFQGIQIRRRGITNRGSLRDFKLGQNDYKSGQEFQIRAKISQIKADITNRGKIDYKLGQEFQIGAGITNRCRTDSDYSKSNCFRKIAGNEYFSKLEEEFRLQVIYTLVTCLFFRASREYLNLKLF